MGHEYETLGAAARAQYNPGTNWQPGDSGPRVTGQWGSVPPEGVNYQVEQLVRNAFEDRPGPPEGGFAPTEQRALDAIATMVVRELTTRAMRIDGLNGQLALSEGVLADVQNQLIETLQRVDREVQLRRNAERNELNRASVIREIVAMFVPEGHDWPDNPALYIAEKVYSYTKSSSPLSEAASKYMASQTKQGPDDGGAHDGAE